MRYRGWNLRENKFYKTSTRLSFYSKERAMGAGIQFPDIAEGSLFYVVSRGFPDGQTSIDGEVFNLVTILVIHGENIGWVRPWPHTYFIRQEED